MARQGVEGQLEICSRDFQTRPKFVICFLSGSKKPVRSCRLSANIIRSQKEGIGVGGAGGREGAFDFWLQSARFWLLFSKIKI